MAIRRESNRPTACNSALDATRGEPRFGRREALRRADMVPLAVMDDRGETASLDRAGPQWIDWESACFFAREEAAVQQLHAREEVRRDLGLGAPAHRAQWIDDEIAAAFETHRRHRAL